MVSRNTPNRLGLAIRLLVNPARVLPWPRGN